jgi:SAM-dependent methyltransferase
MKDIEKIFVDSEGAVFKGDQANKLFDSQNDMKYLTEDGILQVPMSRWEKEQRYELQFSMVRHISESDDRNIEHCNYFEQYRALPKVPYGNYIELGCGPFTNSRIILPLLQDVGSACLLDPLIKKYMEHPNCYYREGVMCGYPIRTIDSSIEAFNPDKTYDIVVLINVLEHCFDVPLIFEKIKSMLSENGVLIFSEATMCQDSLKKVASSIYDEGHAVRLSTKFIDNFLGMFHTIFRKDYFGMYEQPWRHDIYFIGRKKG